MIRTFPSGTFTIRLPPEDGREKRTLPKRLWKENGKKMVEPLSFKGHGEYYGRKGREQDNVINKTR